MRKTILVTGAHRSGSTWIGKVISTANKVRYVSEPFNMLGHKKYIPFKYWFQFISDKSTKEEQDIANKYIKSFIAVTPAALFRDFLKIRNLKGLQLYLKDFNTRKTHRALLKDPIAFFSTPWIAENFNADVVVSVRHPAAFIASLKVKNWEFEFNNFLNQPNLMTDFLPKYQEQVKEYANNRPDIIKQGILLWNIIYSTALRYKQQYSNWYFVTHEALSLNPISEFEKLFNYLNLSFSENVKKELLASTTASENSKLKRNAKENILSWKKRLTDDEIALIKTETNDVWKAFYDDNSWN